MDKEGLITLSGRRVLVTGGTAGIGLATCRHLLDAGAKVFTFSPDPERVAIGRSRLPEATVVLGDQGDVADLTRVVDEAVASLGGIDAIVVNAGVGASSVTDMATDAWLRTVGINLIGPMHLASLGATRLAASGGGHLVFLGSMSAKTLS